jgi:endonuclease/exonuclease/phosphatase family metal-dependent hydrolase
LRYRKDKDKKFIGHPEDDLDKLKKDFVELLEDRGLPLIVTGDFNYDMEEIPAVFKKFGKQNLKLVDVFENQTQATFEQDWGERHWFRMDYMFVSKMLNDCITQRRGGNLEFPESLSMSDHSPLIIEIDFSDFL